MSVKSSETEVIKSAEIKEQVITLTMSNTGKDKTKVGDLKISINGMTTAQAFYASLALFEQIIKRFDSTTAAEFVANKIRLVHDLADKFEEVGKKDE